MSQRIGARKKNTPRPTNLHISYLEVVVKITVHYFFESKIWTTHTMKWNKIEFEVQEARKANEIENTSWWF